MTAVHYNGGIKLLTAFSPHLNKANVVNYELIYQLDAIEYLFVYFQLDVFRAYTPIFRSNGCYNFLHIQHMVSLV